MVLELPRPQGSTLASLTPLVAKLLAYALSFTFLAIYWNNHHHLFQVVERVNGAVLWANLHLLFWLSLVPFVTGWAGDNGSVSLPVALYGTVLILAGLTTQWKFPGQPTQPLLCDTRLRLAIGSSAGSFRNLVRRKR